MKLEINWSQTFKNNFIKNSYGYATFFDYYFQRYTNQDILTECRKWEGRWAFVKMYCKTFKNRLIYKELRY